MSMIEELRQQRDLARNAAVALEQELAAMHDALHAAYLSGIRVALERVDPTGRAAKQLRDLLASEEAA